MIITILIYLDCSLGGFTPALKALGSLRYLTLRECFFLRVHGTYYWQFRSPCWMLWYHRLAHAGRTEPCWARPKNSTQIWRNNKKPAKLVKSIAKVRPLTKQSCCNLKSLILPEWMKWRKLGTKLREEAPNRPAPKLELERRLDVYVYAWNICDYSDDICKE